MLIHNYDEVKKSLTIGSGESAKEYSGIDPQVFKGMLDAVLAMPTAIQEATMTKWVSAFGTLVRKSEKDALTQAETELQSEVDKQAGALLAKYGAFAKAFDAKMAGRKTLLGVETWQARGVPTKESPVFKGIAKSPKLSALHKEFGENVKLDAIQTDDEDPESLAWRVTADDPLAFEAFQPGIALNLELAGIANKANADLGNKVKVVDAHFGIDDETKAPKIVWGKSAGGGGGSVSGRQVATGWVANGKTYATAQEVCKALGFSAKPTPDGTIYWQKSPGLLKAIEAGTVKRVYAEKKSEPAAAGK